MGLELEVDTMALGCGVTPSNTDRASMREAERGSERRRGRRGRRGGDCRRRKSGDSFSVTSLGDLNGLEAKLLGDAFSFELFLCLFGVVSVFVLDECVESPSDGHFLLHHGSCRLLCLHQQARKAKGKKKEEKEQKQTKRRGDVGQFFFGETRVNVAQEERGVFLSPSNTDGPVEQDYNTKRKREKEKNNNTGSVSRVSFLKAKGGNEGRRRKKKESTNLND